MDKHVLKGLVKAWQSEIDADEVRNGSSDAALANAKLDGQRDGIKYCITQLKQVIEIFG